MPGGNGGPGAPGGHGGNGGGQAPQPDPVQLTAVCFPSSIRCEDDHCDRDNALLFPDFESHGLGGPLGQGAVEPSIHSNSLYYFYYPNKHGQVNILAEAFLTGDMSTNTQPLYLLNFLLPFGKVTSLAAVTLKLELVVWKFSSFFSSTELVVADFSSENGADHSLAFRDDLYVLTHSVAVEDTEWIVIEFRVTAILRGVSPTGKAVIDFGKGNKSNGFNYGIRVPQLCVLPVAEVIHGGE